MKNKSKVKFRLIWRSEHIKRNRKGKVSLFKEDEKDKGIFYCGLTGNKIIEKNISKNVFFI